jgi:cytosine/adenosine deaminase-related metal-dependent hydrolase
MHNRLRLERLTVLGNGRPSPAESVLEMATRGGARALNLQVGAIEPGLWADFVTLNLGDPTLAGWQDETLASLVAFSADSRAVVDVIVGGRAVVADCSHPLAALSARDFGGVVRGLGAP